MRGAARSRLVTAAPPVDIQRDGRGHRPRVGCGPSPPASRLFVGVRLGCSSCPAGDSTARGSVPCLWATIARVPEVPGSDNSHGRSRAATRPKGRRCCTPPTIRHPLGLARRGQRRVGHLAPLRRDLRSLKGPPFADPLVSHSRIRSSSAQRRSTKRMQWTPLPGSVFSTSGLGSAVEGGCVYLPTPRILGVLDALSGPTGTRPHPPPFATPTRRRASPSTALAAHATVLPSSEAPPPDPPRREQPSAHQALAVTSRGRTNEHHAVKQKTRTPTPTPTPVPAPAP